MMQARKLETDRKVLATVVEYGDDFGVTPTHHGEPPLPTYQPTNVHTQRALTEDLEREAQKMDRKASDDQYR